jgi:hypothetical protein
MSKEHKVRQGECISSIADKYGFFPDTIWNDSANAQLKEKRKDPNVLYPGDVVVVPDKEMKEESGATETRHRFRRKGVPEVLKIVLRKEGEPRANESYVLEIDGELFSGTTDSEGRIEHPIPPGAKSGTLTIGEEPDAEEHKLMLGHMDPIDEVSGVQARLNNLGFDCGQADGKMSPQTVAAIKAFQAKAGLSATGEIDQATRDALVSEHGS